MPSDEKPKKMKIDPFEEKPSCEDTEALSLVPEDVEQKQLERSQIFSVVSSLASGMRGLDASVAKSAVDAVLSNFENKLRIYYIASAQNEVQRIAKLDDRLAIIDKDLLDDATLANLSPADLLRLRVELCREKESALKRIKSVMDMRQEFLAAVKETPEILDMGTKEEREYQEFSIQTRENMRTVIDAMWVDIEDGEEEES